MSMGFSADAGEATRAGFGHRFAGVRPAATGAKDPVPPYWITAQSNCPNFSLEFPIKLPDQARAIRLAGDSEVFAAIKEFVEKTSQSKSVTSARGEDARMDKMRWTIEARTADGKPQFPEFQRAIAQRRLREADKNSGVQPPTGGRVTVRDVICIQNLPVWWKFAAARREMKEHYTGAMGTNTVYYAVTSEPGLDGMRHLPVVDPEIGETMLFHCADVNAVENITRGGFLARYGGNYGTAAAPRYGMLGQGSYFSNELAKGLTYTRCVLCGDFECACRSLETKRKIARATILARVILGNVRYYPALASIRKKLGGRQGIEDQFRPIAHDNPMYHAPNTRTFDSAVSHGFSGNKLFDFGSEANEFMSPKDQLTYPEFVVSFVMGQDDVAPGLKEIVGTVLARYQGRSFGFLRKKSEASQKAETLLGDAIKSGRSDEEIGDLVLYLVGVKQHVNGVKPDGAGQLKTDGTLFQYLTEELKKHGYLAVA
ncbi:MAG: hypothetical protein EBR28_09165 [Planctomycetia bacterium]|nr:hypothetical protein [Planctomycetia bacterium]